MKHNTQANTMLRTLIAFCILLTGVHISAQSITWTFVNAAGFEDGAQGSLRWTMGEPLTLEVSDGSASLRVGFLPFAFVEEGSSATSQLDPDITLTVSPNPAAENIQVVLPDSDTYTLRVVSMNGTTVLRSTATSEARLDLSALPAGSYILFASNPEGAFNTTTFIKS